MYASIGFMLCCFYVDFDYSFIYVLEYWACGFVEMKKRYPVKEIPLIIYHYRDIVILR